MRKPLVTAKWLHKNLADPDLVLLNASPSSNISGLKSDAEDIQIVGSRHFDLKKNFSDKKSELPNMLPSPKAFQREVRKLGINQNSKIVVYDNLGIYTSPRVWWMFKAMGHEEVAVLNGGLPSWVKQGFDIESLQQQTYERGNFKANLQDHLVKDFDFVIKNSKKPNSLVIDARSEGRFSGAAPEPRAGLRSGSIPNSINIPFQSVLRNGKFKSKKALMEIFEKVNSDERSLVFSCGSGLTACIVLLANEIVNDKPKSVYDGSWTEWAQRVTGNG